MCFRVIHVLPEHLSHKRVVPRLCLLLVLLLVEGLGCMVQDLGFLVSGFWCMVYGLGFRVQVSMRKSAEMDPS